MRSFIMDSNIAGIAALLASGVDERYENNMTALMIAANEGKLDVVQYLVDKCNAAVDLQGKDGITALMCASQQGHIEVVKYLVGKNAAIEVIDANGITALIYAVIAGHLEVVKYLVEIAGASMVVPDSESRSALLYAAGYGYAEVVQYLLESGADISATDAYGNTALSLALGLDNFGVVKRLIYSGKALAVYLSGLLNPKRAVSALDFLFSIVESAPNFQPTASDNSSYRLLTGIRAMLSRLGDEGAVNVNRLGLLVAGICGVVFPVDVITNLKNMTLPKFEGMTSLMRLVKFTDPSHDFNAYFSMYILMFKKVGATMLENIPDVLKAKILSFMVQGDVAVVMKNIPSEGLVAVSPIATGRAAVDEPDMKQAKRAAL